VHTNVPTIRLNRCKCVYDSRRYEHANICHWVLNSFGSQTHWRLRDGSMPSREQFMLLLHQPEALHIKASNRAAMTVSTLSDVRLIVARERTSVPPDTLATADLAGAVEQCTCPPPYTGDCCARVSTENSLRQARRARTVPLDTTDCARRRRRRSARACHVSATAIHTTVTCTQVS
jgi:hypothetical protein